MNSISTTTRLILTLMFFFSLSAKTYTLDEVPLVQKSEKDSYFDVASLKELAQSSDESQIDDISRKLSDYFISAGFHFESKDRFTTLKEGFRSHTYITPSNINQKQPVFIVEMPVSNVFLLAYVKFLADKIQKLQTQINIVFAQIRNHGSPEIAINFIKFYTCLRTISVTSQTGSDQFPCVIDTIRSLDLKNESTLTELANTYIALYRASRISIQMPEPINLRDNLLRNACKTFRDPLVKMQLNSSILLRGIQQPSFRDQLTRANPEWDQAQSLYYATPRITHLMGPYVSSTEEPEMHDAEYDTIQRRLCGPF